MAVSSEPQASAIFAPKKQQIVEGGLLNVIIYVMVKGQFKKFVMETIPWLGPKLHFKPLKILFPHIMVRSSAP